MKISVKTCSSGASFVPEVPLARLKREELTMSCVDWDVVLSVTEVEIRCLHHMRFVLLELLDVVGLVDRRDVYCGSPLAI